MIMTLAIYFNSIHIGLLKIRPGMCSDILFAKIQKSKFLGNGLIQIKNQKSGVFGQMLFYRKCKARQNVEPFVG